MGKRILLVDDEPLILKGLKYTLEQDGYETDTAVDGQEALDKFFSGEYTINNFNFNIITIDFSNDIKNITAI